METAHAKRDGLRWNPVETAQAEEIVRSLMSYRTPRAAVPPSFQPISFVPNAAGNLIPGLYQFPPQYGPTANFGYIPARHLYRVLGFDESHPFRWNLEHKLVQALVLNHFCPCSVPVTRGLGRHWSERMRSVSVEALHSELSAEYVKRTLGFGATSDNRDETEKALQFLISEETRMPRGLVDEVWILQERLSVSEEFRVHSIEDSVVEDLTFTRHSREPVREGKSGPNRYVEEVVRCLPDALLANTICGWDIVKIGQEYKVIEINFSGDHPFEKPGFQCSGFLSQKTWGPTVFARLLRFVESKYRIQFQCGKAEGADPALNAMYWWISRWMDFLRVSNSIDELAACIREAKDSGELSNSEHSEYQPVQDLLERLVNRLKTTVGLIS